MRAVNDASGQRIYLAGFDVFRLDAAEYGRCLQRACASFGFEGIYPLDAVAPANLAPRDKARWIYGANVDAIRRSDIVMANVGDFRGAGEPDTGTAFEIGFAAALGKPIWGYRHDLTVLRERVPGTETAVGQVCERGYLVEDFALSLNLMLACAMRIVEGGPVDCLRAIAEVYGTGATTPSSCRQNGESEIRQVEG
ncbi:nucleoside 2-deoxyribosyltransferase [Paraburkholderia graminis]|uniref:nucleoside 2-deoxyribosyltransferase n=1 Tax=Paraburkholderia graminis TaxID=60548 RepID=UPI0038B70D55